MNAGEKSVTIAGVTLGNGDVAVIDKDSNLVKEAGTWAQKMQADGTIKIVLTARTITFGEGATAITMNVKFEENGNIIPGEFGLA